MAANINFEIPRMLNATSPPERRGIRRDYVRMMVLDRATGQFTHRYFHQIDQFLNPGDLLVMNNSRTIPAALSPSWYRRGKLLNISVEIRLAYQKNENSWDALITIKGVKEGDRFYFSEHLHATLVYHDHGNPLSTLEFNISGFPLYEQFYKLGQPVRYEYIDQPWDLDYYQTVFASVPGSVEMPSAGRAFSWELIFRLRRKGIQTAFIQLHTGLSYLLDDQWSPSPKDVFEHFTVPSETVAAVKNTKRNGGKVIAVGTTAVRALESAVNEEGVLCAKSGVTHLYIDEKYPLIAADGLISGFHEPEASHLDLLSAFVSEDFLQRAYDEAVEQKYLWHEFGDMQLIV